MPDKGAAAAVSGQRAVRRIPPRAAAEPIPLVPGDGPPAEAWDAYFQNHRPPAADVADVVLRLHKAQRTEEVIACLEGALLNGQSQPWMYTVLALAMEKAGRPQDQINRVLMSIVDPSAVNLTNALYSAAFLTRFGAHAEALAMYRQASTIDPARVEPYVLGLKLAGEQGQPESVAWAAAGILSRAWGKDYQKLHSDALAVADDLEAKLRAAGRDEQANALARAVQDARQRDLFVELSWSGKADLDLLVEEPGGTVCSFEQPQTASGGIFVHDGHGGDAGDAVDRYVCPKGLSGEYRLLVRYVTGDVVGKRALLRMVRYQGSPYEIVDQHVVQLGESDKTVRLSLTRGRLAEMAFAPLLRDAPGEEPNPARDLSRLLGRRNREGGRAGNPQAAGGRPFAGPGTGYQPVITILSEGAALAALAVVSGDRRYVRMSLSPVFSTLTDVFTFSFINTGNATGGGQGGARGTGGTGGIGGGTGRP